MVSEYVSRVKLVSAETYYKELFTFNNEEFMLDSDLARSLRKYIKELREERVQAKYYIVDSEFQQRYF